MNKARFDVLRFIAESRDKISSEAISEKTKYEISEVDSYIEEFKNNGWIDDSNQITSEGLSVLEPFKVKNAIILAAGMSTRFIPVSYELPKGLISVKGEVMTERLIRQLQEAGVSEIVLVVGYMMEKFLYLRDKFGVKLVVNNEFLLFIIISAIFLLHLYIIDFIK